MIVFELLSEKNVNEVWELEKICFEAPWTLKMFTSELTNNISIYYVGRDTDTNTVVSYLGMWLIGDICEITNVAVLPEYRRGGIADKMLDIVFDICDEKNVSVINLEVNATNVPALELYKKRGFKECGLRKKYYQNKYDAILMSKMLGGSSDENSCD